MSRKGMALAKVAVGILILSLLIVLLVFLFKAGIKASSLAEDSECQSSIIAHTTLLQTVKDDIVPEITCPTKYYTITSSDKEKIKYYLAESVKSCWGTWGRGEIELFRTKGTYCHVCSVIDFKKKGMSIEGFNTYLNTHYLQDGKFKGLSYSQYLGSAYMGDVGEVENMNVGGKKSDDVISTDSTYATLFVYAKGESAVRNFFRVTTNPTPIGGKPGTFIGGGLVGAGVGVVVGGLICLTGFGCAIGGPLMAVSVVGGGVVGGAAGVATASSVVDNVGWISVALIRPYEAESLKAHGCEFAPTNQDRQKEKLG